MSPHKINQHISTNVKPLPGSYKEPKDQLGVDPALSELRDCAWRENQETRTDKPYEHLSQWLSRMTLGFQFQSLGAHPSFTKMVSDQCVHRKQIMLDSKIQT